MYSSSKPRIAITLGDPTGIGPEIVAKCLSQEYLRKQCTITVIGSRSILEAAYRKWGTPLDFVSQENSSAFHIYDPQEFSSEDKPNCIEPIEVSSIRMAVSGCLDGFFDAVVTSPICKASLYQRGFAFPGHTEFLAALTKSPHYAMGFIAPGLRVSLVTIHEPLHRVPKVLSAARVLNTIRISHQALQSYFGIMAPSVAVCGLNPHAGEAGHLGTEDRDVIQPAVDAALQEGINVSGPLAADTAFSLALKGKYDLVVAMYHDQGLIPVKVVGFGKSVNITLGLPIIRTSVDHGVAYNIVGKGIADPGSLLAAIDQASEIVTRTSMRRTARVNTPIMERKSASNLFRSTSGV